MFTTSGKTWWTLFCRITGYEVVNLGIKQPIVHILEEAKRVEADAIGMSGLLVKSVGVMEQNLKELNTLEIETPVLLGGRR